MTEEKVEVQESALDKVLSILANDNVATKDMLNKLAEKEKAAEPRIAAMKELIEEVDAMTDISQPLVLKLKTSDKRVHQQVKCRESIQYKGFTFEMRNVTNFDNPFVEMQDGDVDMNDNIVFKNKKITIRPYDICTRRFVLLSKKLGRVYEIVDEKKDRKLKGERAKYIQAANKYIEESDEAKLRAAMLYCTKYKWSAINTMDEDEMLGELLQVAYQSPDIILELKGNPKVEYQAVYNMAVSSGIIRYDEKVGMIKYRNGKEVCSVLPDEDPAVKFSVFVHGNKNGKGIEAYNNIKDKLS